MKSLLLSLAALATTGCAVYAPTVPSTPLIEAGQAEASAVLRGGTAIELNGAYSPAAHVLVTVESALRCTPNGQSDSNDSPDNPIDVHRQLGVGLGTYTVFDEPKRTYLAAVAGMGFAAVDVHHYVLFDGFGYYQARYNRYYGQVYAARQQGNTTSGISLRCTWLQYTRLLENGRPVTTDYARFYLEPTLFMRIGTGALQGQGTLGLSLPSNFDRSVYNHAALSPISGLVSIGLVLRPHLLKPRSEPPVGQ